MVPKLQRIFNRESTLSYLNNKGQGLVEFALILAFCTIIGYGVHELDFDKVLNDVFDNTVESSLTVTFDDTKGQVTPVSSGDNSSETPPGNNNNNNNEEDNNENNNIQNNNENNNNNNNNNQNNYENNTGNNGNENNTNGNTSVDSGETIDFATRKNEVDSWIKKNALVLSGPTDNSLNRGDIIKDGNDYYITLNTNTYDFTHNSLTKQAGWGNDFKKLTGVYRGSDYVYDWYGTTYYQSLSIGDVVITNNGDAYVMLTSGEWINYPVTESSGLKLNL